MNVLALNAGSNTLRYKLVSTGPAERTVADGKVDGVQGPAVVRAAERAVAEAAAHGVDAVAVRVVHGGLRAGPARVTPDLVRELTALSPLAPLHQPTDLALIDAAARAVPGVPVVAVFDTAFHRTLPEVAWRYALPDDITTPPDGPALRRYGFHGIAHQYVVGELRSRAPVGRVVSLHLGGGASACALLDGVSVDTSMGLTPLEGLVMSTRCGDVDPGLLIHLMRQGMTADGIEHVLAKQGGLLGLSAGTGSDLRQLTPAAAAGDARAELALASMAYRARQYVGAYAVALGGLDAVVVAGALAENNPPIRARILGGLAAVGVRFDEGRNGGVGPDTVARLSADDSPVAVWLIPADEERQIAREAAGVLTPA